MKFRITLTAGGIRPIGPPSIDTDEGFVAHIDAVTDALFELEELDGALFDADVSANVTNRWAEITVGVEAPSEPEARAKGLAAIFAAISSAYGVLPEGTIPSSFDVSSTVTKPLVAA